ncbi:unnamed protein product [Tilletia caries]|nr:unnamed protein product [Tilletia caries]
MFEHHSSPLMFDTPDSPLFPSAGTDEESDFSDHADDTFTISAAYRAYAARRDFPGTWKRPLPSLGYAPCVGHQNPPLQHPPFLPRLPSGRSPGRATQPPRVRISCPAQGSGAHRPPHEESSDPLGQQTSIVPTPRPTPRPTQRLDRKALKEPTQHLPPQVCRIATRKMSLSVVQPSSSFYATAPTHPLRPRPTNAVPAPKPRAALSSSNSITSSSPKQRRRIVSESASDIPQSPQSGSRPVPQPERPGHLARQKDDPRSVGIARAATDGHSSSSSVGQARYDPSERSPSSVPKQRSRIKTSSAPAILRPTQSSRLPAARGRPTNTVPAPQPCAAISSTNSTLSPLPKKRSRIESAPSSPNTTSSPSPKKRSRVDSVEVERARADAISRNTVSDPIQAMLRDESLAGVVSLLALHNFDVMQAMPSH